MAEGQFVNAGDIKAVRQRDIGGRPLSWGRVVLVDNGRIVTCVRVGVIRSKVKPLGGSPLKSDLNRIVLGRAVILAGAQRAELRIRAQELILLNGRAGEVAKGRHLLVERGIGGLQRCEVTNV